MDSILKELDISRTMGLISVYCVGVIILINIPNLGPKNAIKLLRIHETILNIISVSDKYNIPDDYIDKYYNALKLFNENTTVETNIPKSNILGSIK